MVAKLDAVNEILGATEDAPVSTLTGVTDSRVTRAITVLDSETLKILKHGLGFNTIFKKTLSPDGSGFINLPTSYLTTIATGCDEGKKYFQRGAKLYDAEEDTDVFTTDVVVNIHLDIDFESIPMHVTDYIIAKSARRFRQEVMGATSKDDLLLETLTRAKFDMEAIESEKLTYSLLDDPQLNAILGGRGKVF